MKIMEKIRGKIAERLKAYFSPEEWERVVEALSDKHIEQQIIVLMRQDKIQLLNQFNEPVYTKQIKDIISHHASMPRGQAHYVGPDILAPTEITYLDGSDVDTSQHNLQGGVNPGSPTSASQASRSKLEMQEQDIRRIETEVREHIRRQSTHKIREDVEHENHEHN